MYNYHQGDYEKHAGDFAFRVDHPLSLSLKFENAAGDLFDSTVTMGSRK